MGKKNSHHKIKVEKVVKIKNNPFPDDKNFTIDYKDVNLLRKFLTERGKIRSRRVTGCSVQRQRELAVAVKNAREAALLPYTSTAK